MRGVATDPVDGQGGKGVRVAIVAVGAAGIYVAVKAWRLSPQYKGATGALLKSAADPADPFLYVVAGLAAIVAWGTR